MKWLFRWWLKGVNQASCEESDKEQTVAISRMANHFDGGMNFQLVDAENGKILKVQVPDPQGNKHGFHPGMPTKEKLYVIPKGENVMDFITCALVEERIK